MTVAPAFILASLLPPFDINNERGRPLRLPNEQICGEVGARKDAAGEKKTGLDHRLLSDSNITLSPELIHEYSTSLTPGAEQHQRALG